MFNINKFDINNLISLNLISIKNYIKIVNHKQNNQEKQSRKTIKDGINGSKKKITSKLKKEKEKLV